ncbi:MAG: hypothetical protein K0S89_561 [Nitrososphaeraceae archaeon]|nr:hypothetical protein [Nitrososphaeraceae archaeon]
MSASSHRREVGSEKEMNAQKGQVIIEGDYATLKYERRLAHPREQDFIPQVAF